MIARPRRTRLAMLGAVALAGAAVHGLVFVDRARRPGAEAGAGSASAPPRRARVLALDALAVEQATRDGRGGAESALKDAVNGWSRRIAADPASIDDRLRLIDAILRLAGWLEERGRWEEAERHLDRGSLACLVLPIVSQGEPRITRKLALVLDRQGGVLEAMGRLTESLETRARAAAAARGIVESPARTPDDVRALIVVLLHSAEALEASNRAAEAAATLDEARRASASLGDNRTLETQDLELAALVFDRSAAISPMRSGSRVEARNWLERAVAMRERAVGLLRSDTNPPVAAIDQALARLADSETALARLLVRDRLIDRAVALARRALDHESERPPRAGSVADQHARGRALIDLAQTLRDKGDLAGALPHARRGAAILLELHSRDRVTRCVRVAASLAAWTLCDLELAAGDHRAAARAVGRYLEIEPAGYDEALESCRFLCRCASLAAADLAVAEGYTRSALAALKTAVERGFRDRDELVRSPLYVVLRPRHEFDRILTDLAELDPISGLSTGHSSAIGSEHERTR